MSNELGRLVLTGLLQRMVFPWECLRVTVHLKRYSLHETSPMGFRNQCVINKGWSSLASKKERVAWRSFPTVSRDVFFLEGLSPSLLVTCSPESRLQSVRAMLTKLLQARTWNTAHTAKSSHAKKVCLLIEKNKNFLAQGWTRKQSLVKNTQNFTKDQLTVTPPGMLHSHVNLFKEQIKNPWPVILQTLSHKQLGL